MEDKGFPVTGNVTTIDQVDRIQTYLDNKAIDGLGWIAGSLDLSQQGITTIAGTVLKALHNRLKKELQRQGRIISKYQKKLDYTAIDSQSIAESDKQQIDSLLDDAPIEIDELDSGSIPSQLAGKGGVTGTNPVVTIGSGTVGVGFLTRINDATCEWESSTDGGGTWVGSGVFDKACQDKANPPPVSLPPGTIGGGLGEWGCAAPVGANIQYISAKICNDNFNVHTYLEPTDWFSKLVLDSSVTREVYTITPETKTARPYPDYGHIYEGNPRSLSTIVTIPINRNMNNSFNWYGEEAGYYLSNKFDVSADGAFNMDGGPVQEWADSVLNIKDYNKYELEYFTMSDELPPGVM